MTPIAVLHLMNAVADCSISRIVQQLVQHLDPGDYRWHIGGLRGPGNMQEEFSHLGAQVVDFSDRRNGSGNLAKKIREYACVHRIRIVHTHTPRTVLAAAVALADTPQAIHLATEHTLYAPGDRRWGLMYTLLDRFTLYLPDHLVAVSHKMCRQIMAFPGLRAGRVTTIQNAVDCESYYVPDQRNACRVELGLSLGSQVIGFTGRIENAKRLDLLLEGFSLILARHPQARLMIVGEGGLRPELESLAVCLGVSHAVVWTGFRQDIPRLLAAMDVYVQPSINEGLSLSILEAMAAERPVVATDVGGTREVVTDQITGILIPAGSSSAVGDAIADLLDNPDKRTAIAQAGRRHVIREFSVQHMTTAYGCLYRTLAVQR